MQIEQIVDAMKKKNSVMKGGIVCDEIEIRAGLVYLTHAGKIVGTVDGPILEKDVAKVSSARMENELHEINLHRMEL